MPSPAVNRDGTHSPGQMPPQTKSIWPARDSRSMSPTRSKPFTGQNKINIVIDSFMLPDAQDSEEKFVRERLYSDEKLDGASSPKALHHGEGSSVSSNPDLEDEFAFNANWNKNLKPGSMLPPTDIFNRKETSRTVQRMMRRSQSEEKNYTNNLHNEPIIDNPNTKDNTGNLLIGQKRIIDTKTGLILEEDVDGLD